jgi:hypothetical protein
MVVLVPDSARADDFKLKDGTKISGTIVGFDDNSFKVKTSYGYALVEKDQVVSISISNPAGAPAPEKKPEPAAEKPASHAKPKSEVVNAAPPALPATSESQPEPAVDVAAAPPQPGAPKKIVATSAATAAPARGSTPAANSVGAKPTPATGTPAAAAPAPVAANVEPPKPPAPEPIREQVTGNTYTNETYRFRMYKPPSWDVIAGARSILPGAVAAMGTSDSTTYLLIGQEPAGKTLASDIDAAERRLRDVMDNFRPLGEGHVTVSGTSAVEHRFRGSVDQHDWSGVVVFVPRGAKLYTIFGMTRADNDLVQIQENVITRAISSLQFTEQ